MLWVDNGICKGGLVHCSPRSRSIRLWVAIWLMCRCMGALRLGICSCMSLMVAVGFVGSGVGRLGGWA